MCVCVGMRISFGMFYVFHRSSTGLKFGVCDMLTFC